VALLFKRRSGAKADFPQTFMTEGPLWKSFRWWGEDNPTLFFSTPETPAKLVF
jgi:hypothetical protein